MVTAFLSLFARLQDFFLLMSQAFLNHETEPWNQAINAFHLTAHTHLHKTQIRTKRVESLKHNSKHKEEIIRQKIRTFRQDNTDSDKAIHIIMSAQQTLRNEGRHTYSDQITHSHRKQTRKYTLRQDDTHSGRSNAQNQVRQDSTHTQTSQ